MIMKQIVYFQYKESSNAGPTKLLSTFDFIKKCVQPERILCTCVVPLALESDGFRPNRILGDKKRKDGAVREEAHF